MESRRDSRLPRNFVRDPPKTPPRDLSPQDLPVNAQTWPRSGTGPEQRPNLSQSRTQPLPSSAFIRSLPEQPEERMRGPAIRDSSQNRQRWQYYRPPPEQQDLNPIDSRRRQPLVPPPRARSASPRAQIRAPNYITLGLFRIDPTIPRISLLISTIRRLSALTGISFWLAAANCFRILASRGTQWRILYEIVAGVLSNTPILTTILRCLFPGAGYAGGHEVRLSVHASGFIHAPAIYSTTISLYPSSIMAWLSLTALMFISHHLLCFFHDCLTQSRQQFGRQNDP